MESGERELPGGIHMLRRNTIQKNLVADAVLQLKDHPSAEEVYHFIQNECPSISKGTVYRNLNALTEEGSIRKIEVPGEADRYDHNTDDHYHVHCIHCGRIFDVDMEPADMTGRIRDTHGFVFFGCDIVFKGICPECNQKGSEK